ncbi:MAG: flagellar basal body-associated FliL family protein [Pseudomonadota bacterium]
MAKSASEPEAETDGDKKKGSGLFLKLAILLVLIAATAGGTFFAMSSGLLGGATTEVAAPEPPPARTYYAVERAFTFNERDGTRLVQVNISLSARGENPLRDRIEPHEAPLRATLLGILMNVKRDDLIDMALQKKLRARLRDGLNEELQTRSGEGDVEEVFFTDLIVQ